MPPDSRVVRRIARFVVLAAAASTSAVAAVAAAPGLAADAVASRAWPLRDPARAGDGFGTNIHWTTPVPGEAAQLASAHRVVRMDVTWAAVEAPAHCGVYEWAAFDGLVAVARSAGFRLLLILDYLTNGCYDGGGPRGCTTDVCLRAFASFAGAAVARYYAADAGVAFELYNEPNLGGVNATTIARLARDVRAAAGPAAAGAVLIGPALAGIDGAYLAAALGAGLLGALDGVSVHPYRDDAPESVLDDLVPSRALIAAHAPPGAAVPVYVSEWGYTTVTQPCGRASYTAPDARAQAALLARVWLTAALAGSPLAIWYEWREPDAPACDDHFGTVGHATGNASEPFAPKAAHVAAAVAQATVGRAGFVRRGAVRSTTPGGYAATAADVFVAVFALPGGAPAVAAWTNLSECGAVNGSARCDCGYPGIGHDECRGRGCCWDPAAQPDGPQCYRGLPPGGGPLLVTFDAAPPDQPGLCFDSVLDFLGAPLPPACAVDGALTLNVTGAPVYAAAAAGFGQEGDR